MLLSSLSDLLQPKELTDKPYHCSFSLPTPLSLYLPDLTGFGRSDHDGDALIAAAVNSSSNVIVVMHIPGVVDVEKWVDNENVTAIVAAWMPGQESGNSLVDVLYGDVNPSGKLPFTWGKSEDDYPVCY